MRGVKEICLLVAAILLVHNASTASSGVGPHSKCWDILGAENIILAESTQISGQHIATKLSFSPADIWEALAVGSAGNESNPVARSCKLPRRTVMEMPIRCSDFPLIERAETCKTFAGMWFVRNRQTTITKSYLKRWEGIGTKSHFYSDTESNINVIAWNGWNSDF